MDPSHHPCLPYSAFDDVGTVLSALRDHDPALGAALDAARANLGMGMGMPSIPGNVITDFPDQLDGDIHAALRTRLVTQTTKPFWEQFQKLADHITAHGSLPKTQHGKGAAQVRTLLARASSSGLHDPRGNRALQALPGWFWRQPRWHFLHRHRRQFGAEGIESATGAITWTSSGIRTMLTTNAQRKSVASSRPTTAQAPLG
jgi:hypothetical protein